MVNIGHIQQQAGPRPSSPDRSTGAGRNEPVPAHEGLQPEDATQSTVARPTPTPEVKSANPGDPEQIRDYLSRVAAAMENATDGPHLVGFRLDPETGGYLVEVKDREGQLVTTLSSENFLNRSRNSDELTGMLVDSRS